MLSVLVYMQCIANSIIEHQSLCWDGLESRFGDTPGHSQTPLAWNPGWMPDIVGTYFSIVHYSHVI